MSKQKRVKLIIELPQPDGVTMADLKAYVSSAVQVLAQSYTPDGGFFGQFTDRVKVYSPRRKEPKVKK